LAFHSETRIYTKEKIEKDPGFATAHMMQSIQFDSNGAIIPGDRSTLSKGWELVTKSVVLGNDLLLVHPLGVLNDMVNIISSEIQSVYNAGQDLYRDMSDAANSNIEKTKNDIDSIISSGTQKIRQNIINASGNVDVINNEIKKGLHPQNLWVVFGSGRFPSV